MIKIVKLLFVLLLITSPVYAHSHKESYYQNKWCSANNGKQEVVLDDGARVDCLTEQYAVEFDFANKWAESVGQSLYYALMTGKKPAVVLIMENPVKETRYLMRLDKVAKKYGITVFTMGEE